MKLQSDTYRETYKPSTEAGKKRQLAEAKNQKRQTAKPRRQHLASSPDSLTDDWMRWWAMPRAKSSTGWAAGGADSGAVLIVRDKVRGRIGGWGATCATVDGKFE